jgi:hypothetical protein
MPTEGSSEQSVSRVHADGSQLNVAIAELTDVGLMHRGSREAVVRRMRELCRVGQDQKKFAACLEARLII